MFQVNLVQMVPLGSPHPPPVLRRKPIGISGMGLLPAGCLSCHPPSVSKHCKKNLWPDFFSQSQPQTTHFTPDGRGISLFMPVA